MYDCDQCGFKTGHKQALTKHKITIHDKIKVECKDCNKVLAKTVLKRHMNMFHRENVDILNCDLCEFKTLHKISLARHKDRIHLRVGVKKYPCPICDTSNKERGDLKRHIQAMHMNKELTCGICDFKTSSDRYLTNHKKVVHGPKKFECLHCKFRTASQSNLTAHNLRKHKINA